LPRPRKPTSLLELSGAFAKNPTRRRPAEPRDDRPLGDPPTRLPAAAVPYWREIASLAPARVLCAADRLAVELAARLMLKACQGDNASVLLDLVEAARAGKLTNKELRAVAVRQTISSAELATLRSLLAAFGMTPADRSKLSIPAERPPNPWDEFAAEARRPRPA
jgi:phage terminase small subunit